MHEGPTPRTPFGAIRLGHPSLMDTQARRIDFVLATCPVTQYDGKGLSWTEAGLTACARTEATHEIWHL